MTTDLGRVDTRVVSVEGSTVLLSLATNGAALFSVDGGSVWHRLRTQEVEGAAPVYDFISGLTEDNGIVTIDTDVVPTLDPSTGFLRLSQLPTELPIIYDNGLSVDGFHKLSVTSPNTPGNIVVLPDSGILPGEMLPENIVFTVDGKIPDQLLPPPVEQIIYTAGDGIVISPDRVISEDWKDYR